MSGSYLETETWRGLQRPGRAQRAYLFCLGFQCLAVILWWPDAGAIAAERAPGTLFAVLLATGVSLSYQSIRMGAEELMLDGQHSIREWLLSTSVPEWRIAAGYLVAHLLQSLHWLLLSAPVLMVAWSVGGNDWGVLGSCLLVMLVMASGFRIIGSIVYLLVGHHAQLTWYSLRVILVSGYIAGTLLSPATSYWHITQELLSMSYADTESQLPTRFLLVYASLLALLSLFFVAVALRIRANQHRIKP